MGSGDTSRPHGGDSTHPDQCGGRCLAAAVRQAAGSGGGSSSAAAEAAAA
jgi:hypothetical protein